MPRAPLLVLLFALLVLAGDRLIAAGLRTVIEASPQAHARLYAGRTRPVDVLFMGSSRSREHFPAELIEDRTGQRAANLGWGGLSSEQVEAIFLDFVDRVGRPRVLVLEVTSPEVDQLMIRNLRLFERDSERISALVAEEEPTLHALDSLFGMLRYNNKLFFDMVRYDLGEGDYLTEERIDRRTLQRIRRENHIEWSWRQEDIEATANIVARAQELGIAVAPVITPMLPHYLRRLDGFTEWRARVEEALPDGVRLWDYSSAIRNTDRFRDDLHLNRRGVMQLVERMRRDGVPGIAAPGRPTEGRRRD
jgi:hypothetical protein